MHARNRTWLLGSDPVERCRQRTMPVEGGDGSTLTLDFTTGVLDPRLTFTRSGTATFINASGVVATASTNTPRFDHDPTTGSPRGLLIEGSAVNLINWSETFDTTGGVTNWNWSALNVTRGTVTTTNPTGASATVIKIEETTTNGIHAPLTVPVVSASTTYTFSVWAKAVERTFVQLFENGGSGATSMVNLSTGAVVSESTAGITTVTPLGTTGWYRISMRLTTIVGQTTANCQLRLSTNGTTTSYAGTTGSGIYIWGAQLEAGSGASSYIPTGASQGTRNADICYIPDGDHSWFTSKNNCVMFMQCEIPRTSNFGNLMYLGQWSGGEYAYGHQVYSYATSAVSMQTKINAATSTDQTLFNNQPVPINLKIAMCPNSDAGRLARAWNGTASETTGLTPTASRFPAWTQQARFGIGTNAVSLGSSTACNIYVRTVKFFPFAMSNAQLQSLTT